MRRVHGGRGHEETGSQRVPHEAARGRGQGSPYRYRDAEGRRVGVHARMDLPHRRHSLLPRVGDGPAPVPDYRQGFPVCDREGDQGAGDGEGGEAPRHAGGLRRRRQQRHRDVLRLHQGRGRGTGRMRGRRQGHRHVRDRGNHQHRQAGDISRHEVLFLPGRVRPDSAGVFHICRAGLSRRGPGARMAPRHIQGQVRGGDRRGGGGGVRVPLPH